jgi:NADH pyrophosphatase NudC (nudix superfamily)
MARPFRFCPADGTELVDSGNDSGDRCPQCDRTWYHNAAPTAGAAIVDGSRALVTKRAREPEKGRFDVPGGFLEAEEGPIEGLKREVREELGIDVDVSLSDLVQMVPHPYGDDGDYVLSLGFKARYVGGDPTPADDVADVQWVTAADLDAVDFAWEHDRDLVRKALGA